jgi:hypothetical protein
VQLVKPLNTSRKITLKNAHPARNITLNSGTVLMSSEPKFEESKVSIHKKMNDTFGTTLRINPDQINRGPINLNALSPKTKVDLKVMNLNFVNESALVQSKRDDSA